MSIVEGMQAAAKDRGIDLIDSDAAADASKHISHIEDFIAQAWTPSSSAPSTRKRRWTR